MKQYTDKVKTILTEEQTAIKAIRADLNKLETEYRAERVTGKVYSERRAELQKQIDVLKLGAAEEIGKVKAEAVAAFEAASVITPEMLNADAEIVKSGITLTAAQFAALVERNAGNEFVNTLLRQYAAKHPEGLDGVALPVTSTAKISAFSVFAEKAAGAAKDPDGLTWALIADGKADPEGMVDA